MVKAQTLGTDYCLNDHAFVSKATVKLADGIKAQLAHRHPGNALALTLTGGCWELQHNFDNKDTRMKYKTKVAGSALVIKQYVPAGKMYLIPSPEVEVSRMGLLGKHSKMLGSYDCFSRVGKLEETIYAGDDKQHKAFVKLSTAAGATAGLRSKLPAAAGPLLHSAAASYSQKGGWELACKSKFADGTKVKGSYSVDRDVLTVSAKHTPAYEAGGAKTTLSLSMIVPVHKQQDPRIMFGLKRDL